MLIRKLSGFAIRWASLCLHSLQSLHKTLWSDLQFGFTSFYFFHTQVRSLVQGKTNKIYQEYRAVLSMDQLVKGTNYLFKVINVVILILKRVRMSRIHELNKVWHPAALLLNAQYTRSRWKYLLKDPIHFSLSCRFVLEIATTFMFRSTKLFPVMEDILSWEVYWRTKPKTTRSKHSAIKNLHAAVSASSSWNDSTQCWLTIHDFWLWASQQHMKMKMLLFGRNKLNELLSEEIKKVWSISCVLCVFFRRHLTH